MTSERCPLAVALDTSSAVKTLRQRSGAAFWKRIAVFPQKRSHLAALDGPSVRASHRGITMRAHSRL